MNNYSDVDFDFGFGFGLGLGFGFNFTSDNNTFVPEFIPDPLVSVIGWRHYFALVCYAIVIVLGVPGNSLVIWVTAFRMPRSVNALWFLNLAIADLLCCLSLPLIMVPLAQDNHWPFGPVACKFLSGVFYTLMYCSVLLLMLISLDRWLLVSRPTWCQNWRHPRYASWACLAIWLLAIVGSTPQFAHMEEDHNGSKIECVGIYSSLIHAWSMGIFRFLMGFLIPFMIICISHWMVYQRAGQGPGQRQNTKSRRTLRVILAVVLSFFLCWIPLHIVDIARLATIRSISTNTTANLRLAHVLTLCLAYFNSCLNPLLYVCLGRGFRESLTKSLRSVLHLGSEEPSRGLSLTGNTKSTTDNTALKARNTLK